MTVVEVVVAMYRMSDREQEVGERAFLLIVYQPAILLPAVPFPIFNLHTILRSHVPRLSVL